MLGSLAQIFADSQVTTPTRYRRARVKIQRRCKSTCIQMHGTYTPRSRLASRGSVPRFGTHRRGCTDSWADSTQVPDDRTPSVHTSTRTAHARADKTLRQSDAHLPLSADARQCVFIVGWRRDAETHSGRQCSHRILDAGGASPVVIDARRESEQERLRHAGAWQVHVPRCPKCHIRKAGRVLLGVQVIEDQHIDVLTHLHLPHRMILKPSIYSRRSDMPPENVVTFYLGLSTSSPRFTVYRTDHSRVV